MGRKSKATATATGGNLLKSYLGSGENSLSFSFSSLPLASLFNTLPILTIPWTSTPFPFPSGILGLPYAFSQGGVVATTIILSLIGGIATHTMMLLVQTRQKCNGYIQFSVFFLFFCFLTRPTEENKRVITYGDIAEYLLGKWGKYLLNAALIFTQFGFCCVYVVFCIDNTSFLLCSFGLSCLHFLSSLSFFDRHTGLGTMNTGGDLSEPPCTPSITEKVWVFPWFVFFLCFFFLSFFQNQEKAFPTFPQPVPSPLRFIIFTFLSWIRTLSGVAYVSNFANMTTGLAMLAIYTASIIQIIYKIEDTEENMDVAIAPPPATVAGFFFSSVFSSFLLFSFPGPPLSFFFVVSLPPSQFFLPPPFATPSLPTVMLSLGIYAFEGIGTVLPSVTAMKNPEKFPSVLKFVMVFSTVNYVMFGLLPYLAFGRNTSDEVTGIITRASKCDICQGYLLTCSFYR